MHPNLQQLIELQQTQNEVEELQRRIDEIPATLEACDVRLATRSVALEAAKSRDAANQHQRRGAEKDLDEVQRRLSRFKGQLMDVKTNREYQAMLKEIAGAEREKQALEDRILEILLEADGLAAEVAREEADLAAEKAAVAEERQALEASGADFGQRREASVGARDRLSAQMDPAALSLFESVSRARRGVAVVEARAGHCGSCHVRLRPQIFNDIRLNERIIQCESCQRILYFTEKAASEQLGVEP